jgi:serine/threonine-protein kinase RsbW
MSDNRWIWRCDRVIPSNMEAGRRILAELLRELESAGWSRRDIFAVHLAMEESLVNAIRHGNRLDPSKRVSIQCRMDSDLVRIEITDEGPGFDPNEIPDPTAADRLDVPGGRGLLLMRTFMSRVEFSDRGRRILLERRRSNAA